MVKRALQKYRSRKRRRGQATVELALVMMVLALLLVGIADVARIYSEHLAAVHAAAVGARWLTLDPNYQKCSAYTAVGTPVVQDLSSTIKPSNILAVAVQTPLPGNTPSVRVNVTYHHDFLFGLINNVPSNFTVGATMPGAASTPSGACPSPPPTLTPVPTATPNPCPLQFSAQYTIQKKNNGVGTITIIVTLLNAQGNPVSNATVTAQVVGDPIHTFTLASQGNGVYSGCTSPFTYGRFPQVMVTANNGICPQISQQFDSSQGGSGCPPP